MEIVRRGTEKSVFEGANEVIRKNVLIIVHSEQSGCLKITDFWSRIHRK